MRKKKDVRIMTPARIAILSFAVVLSAVRIAEAQFASPTCVPPNCSPSVIQNIAIGGTTQTASINIAGDAKIGSSLNLGAGTFAIPAAGNYILANVASGGAGANLMNLQVAAVSKFLVDLLGNLVAIGDADIRGGDVRNTLGALTLTSANNTNVNLTAPGTGNVVLGAGDGLVAGTTTYGNGTITSTAGGITVTAPVNTNITLQTSGTGNVTIPGNTTINGNLSVPSGSLTGSGAALTNLNASQLTSGTVPSAAISGTYTNAVTFNNAANSFTGTYSGDGAALTNLNASNLASGTLPDGRLTGTYTGALTFSNAANSFTGNGAGLTALNGSNITTGTVATGRLPGTVVYTNTAQTISGAKIFSAATTALNGMTTFGLNTLVLSGTQNLLYGTVSNTSPGTTSLLKLESYNGTGYDPEFVVAPNGNTTINGTLNVSGTITGGGLASAAGTLNAVSKFTAGSTLGDSQIFDDGTKVGFGTATPAARFHVANGGNVVFDGVIAETPPTGTGTRFLWYPYYASFRAGRARDDRWDAGSIGWASAAFGDETRAKGNWSFAAGDRTFADGEGSVAFGIDSSADANSYGSAVFGYSRAVNADWALGAGSYNLITADYGVALGYNNAVSGMTSAAIGGTNLASGVVSFALGTCVTASAYTSFIFGNSTCVAGGGGVLNNNNDHSFMVGFDSSIPTVVIEGLHNVTVGTGPKQLTVNGQAHTGIAAGQEANDIDFNLARTVQWLAGAIPTQRAAVIRAPTYSFTGASTITNAATLAVTGAPVAGANATITNPYAFWVQAGNAKFAGNVTVDGALTVGGSAMHTGTGTSGKLVKWTGANSQGDDPIMNEYYAATQWLLGINNPTPNYVLDVIPNGTNNGALARFANSAGAAYNAAASIEAGTAGESVLALSNSGFYRRGEVSYNHSAGNLIIRNSTGLAAITIDTPNNTLFNNSVGIGDTTPAATFTVGNGDKFQVAGADGDLTFTDPQASITFPAEASASPPMMHLFASGTSNADRMVIGHSPAYPNWGLQYSDALDKFNFLNNGNPVMTVDLGASKVGIGTLSPSTLLDVNPASGQGSATLQSGNDIGGFIRLERRGVPGSFYSIETGANNNDNLAIHRGSAPYADLVVGNGGNIGVGTISPGYALDVDREVGNTPAKFGSVFPVYMANNAPAIGFNLYFNGNWKFGKGSAPAFGGYITLNHTTGDFAFVTTNSGNADVVSTNTERMRILNNGNVGVGTGAPDSKMQIYGSGTTQLKVTGGTSSAVGTVVLSENSYGWIGTQTNHPLYIGTGYSGKVYIDTAGKVEVMNRLRVGTPSAPDDTDYGISSYGYATGGYFTNAWGVQVHIARYGGGMYSGGYDSGGHFQDLNVGGAEGWVAEGGYAFRGIGVIYTTGDLNAPNNTWGSGDGWHYCEMDSYTAGWKYCTCANGTFIGNIAFANPGNYGIAYEAATYCYKP